MNTSALTIPVPDGNLHIAVYGAQNLIPVVLLHGTAAYGLRRGVSPPIRWAARNGLMNGMFIGAMRNQMKPKMLSKLLGIPRDDITPDFIKNWTKPFSHPNLPYIIAKTLADDDTGILSNEISSIIAPTLLIHGTKDRFIPKRVFEQYQQKLTALQTTVYEGYGHVLMEQCPERLAASIKAFVEKNVSF